MWTLLKCLRVKDGYIHKPVKNEKGRKHFELIT